MSGTKPAFQLLGEEELRKAQAAAPAPQQPTATANLLLLALRALSQRALTAITNAFSLILVFSVCALVSGILPEPSTHGLIAVGGYAVFCLLIDIARRRSR